MKFTKNNLIAGETIVIDNFGNERLIIEVWENSFLVSLSSSFTTHGYLLTFKEAEANGWKIKGVKAKTKIDAFKEFLNCECCINVVERDTIAREAERLFGE